MQLKEEEDYNNLKRLFLQDILGEKEENREGQRRDKNTMRGREIKVREKRKKNHLDHNRFIYLFGVNVSAPRTGLDLPGPQAHSDWTLPAFPAEVGEAPVPLVHGLAGPLHSLGPLRGSWKERGRGCLPVLPCRTRRRPYRRRRRLCRLCGTTTPTATVCTTRATY